MVSVNRPAPPETTEACIASPGEIAPGMSTGPPGNISYHAEWTGRPPEQSASVPICSTVLLPSPSSRSRTRRTRSATAGDAGLGPVGGDRGEAAAGGRVAGPVRGRAGAGAVGERPGGAVHQARGCCRSADDDSPIWRRPAPRRPRSGGGEKTSCVSNLCELRWRLGNRSADVCDEKRKSLIRQDSPHFAPAALHLGGCGEYDASPRSIRSSPNSNRPSGPPVSNIGSASATMFGNLSAGRDLM